MIRCKKCLMPVTRPRAEFENGVCNACLWEEEKRKIDWGKRQNALKKLCSKLKNPNSDYDVIVPASGGKDSTYIADIFKNKLGMRVLTITFASPIYSRIEWHNWNNFVRSGFDNILITPDQKKYVEFAKDWFVNHGFPKQPFVVGISSAVIKMAKKLNIQLICYAENGEIEYGGKQETGLLKKFTKEFLTDIYYEGQKDASKYGAWWQTPSDDDLKNLHVTWYSLFENWDPEPHARVAVTKYGMQMPVSGNISTFTNYGQIENPIHELHMYLCFLKHGFGRCCSDASIEIRKDRLSRENAVDVVNLLDGQFPYEFEELYCDFFSMSKTEFYKVLDKHTNKNLLVYTGHKTKPYVLKKAIR